MIRLRRGKGKRPKTLLLEASVTARIAATKLTMLIRRVHRLASQDPNAEKTLKMLARLQLALEALALRLETLALTGIVSAEELSAVREAIKMLRKEYSTIIPGIDSVLHELEAGIAEAATVARIELEAGEPGSRVSEAAAKILEEAEKVAEERLRSLLGDTASGHGFEGGNPR